MGTEHSHNQINGGEIYPRKLCRGCTCDPIGVNIFIARHKEYMICFRRRREAYLGNIFTAPFLWKIEISHTPLRNSKYDASQEGQPRPPKSHDVRKRKIHKFATCKHGADLRYDRRNRILCCQ